MHLTLSCEVHVLRNCLAYFGQPENGNESVLSGYASSCVYFVHGFWQRNPVVLRYTDDGHVIGE
jgi:hypothetical protein